VRIGLIDGPVDPSTPALQGVPIVQSSVLNDRERMGSPNHATGIASLIAGRPTSETAPGMAPGAQLFSAVAFARNGGRDVARLENLAEALDWMAGRQVGVVNMSLAGPRNDALERIIQRADSLGMVIVAATGNGGNDEVAYPASDPRVIAVTAVDAAKRLYRKANRGPEVDFAAPGVDLLLSQGGGTAFRSGTSYAAAIVTGLVAQEIARSGGGRDAVIRRLRGRAEDLGPKGRDTAYGWGLVRSGGC
jgi:subtilisin family serine protease